MSSLVQLHFIAAIPPPSPLHAHTLPGTFTIGLHNWRRLTGNDGQLRLGPLMDGLADACSKDADIVLSTELGATRCTKGIEGGRYHGDWSCADQPRFGEGVGAFFDAEWTGQWVHLEWVPRPSNCRFYAILRENTLLVTGVFYAPHQGHLSGLDF